MMYDYLIVGAGLAGCIIAKELEKTNKNIAIIDRRNHIGGNCATEKIEGINVHKYGPHIFHTSNEMVRRYILMNANIHEYRHRSIAKVGKKLYELPINLMTINAICGADTPELANTANTQKIRKIIFDGYCQKQWGKKANDVPFEVLERIPVRNNCDDNYFNDSWQCVLEYDHLFKKLVYGSKVILNTSFDKCDIEYCKLIYTGSLDELYGYQFGKLEYRCCTWKTERHDIPYYQGCAVVSYPEKKVPWTRIIEHKYFENTKCEHTYISKEYSGDSGDPAYPVETIENMAIYSKYKELADRDGIYFCGRLAEYKYMDMDKVVLSALETAQRIIANEQ